MLFKRSVTSMVLVLVTLVVGVTHVESRTGSMPPQASARLGLAVTTCKEILIRAIQTVQTNCDNLTRNNACYGNTAVKAEPRNGSVLKFDTAGDRAALQAISTLVTSALNPHEGTWGLSLLKLQANLPNSLPGQNVTFLVFGDTTIENGADNMQAFYFRSGLGSLECQEVPRDGIVVGSPNHTRVVFSANGVQIKLGSTVILRAERHKSMSIELLDGSAEVTSAGTTQTLQPGEMIIVARGGSNGLTAVGPPSAPARATREGTVATLTGLLGNLAMLPALPFTACYQTVIIHGPIQSFDSATNVVNVYGMRIRLRDDDSEKGNIRTGTWIHVAAALDCSKADQRIIAATGYATLSQAPAASGRPGRPGNGQATNNGNTSGSNNSGGGSNSGGSNPPVVQPPTNPPPGGGDDDGGDDDDDGATMMTRQATRRFQATAIDSLHIE
jgi:hypothetical protein